MATARKVEVQGCTNMVRKTLGGVRTPEGGALDPHTGTHFVHSVIGTANAMREQSPYAFSVEFAHIMFKLHVSGWLGQRNVQVAHRC